MRRTTNNNTPIHKQMRNNTSKVLTSNAPPEVFPRRTLTPKCKIVRGVQRKVKTGNAAERAEADGEAEDAVGVVAEAVSAGSLCSPERPASILAEYTFIATPVLALRFAGLSFSLLVSGYCAT